MHQSTRKIKLLHSVGHTVSQLLGELPQGATPVRVVINYEHMSDLKSEIVIIGYRLPVFFISQTDDSSTPGDICLVYTLDKTKTPPSKSK